MPVFLHLREVIITSCSVPLCILFPSNLFLVTSKGIINSFKGANCFGMHAKALFGIEMLRLDVRGGKVFEVVANAQGK